MSEYSSAGWEISKSCHNKFLTSGRRSVRWGGEWVLAGICCKGLHASCLKGGNDLIHLKSSFHLMSTIKKHSNFGLPRALTIFSCNCYCETKAWGKHNLKCLLELWQLIILCYDRTIQSCVQWVMYLCLVLAECLSEMPCISVIFL